MREALIITGGKVCDTQQEDHAVHSTVKPCRSGTVPGKMVFTPVKTGIDILLGQRKSDGILLGDGDYLLEEIEAPDEKERTKNENRPHKRACPEKI